MIFDTGSSVIAYLHLKHRLVHWPVQPAFGHSRGDSSPLSLGHITVARRRVQVGGAQEMWSHIDNTYMSVN